jgi:hypothetical protein
VVLSETWLSPSSLLDLPLYSVYRTDRSGRGGGVCILLDKMYFRNYIVITISVTVPCIEILALQLTCPAYSFVLVYVYRPPLTDKINDEMPFQHLKSLSETHKHLLIFGDFNFPEVEWLYFEDSKWDRFSLIIRRYCLRDKSVADDSASNSIQGISKPFLIRSTLND